MSNESDSSAEITPYEKPELEKDWPEVLDRAANKAIDTFEKVNQRKTETEKEWIRIDRLMLLVFAIALLGSLFFTFYMLAVDKIESVTMVLYPIITGLIGFMGGYFAGTGRMKSKQ